MNVVSRPRHGLSLCAGGRARFEKESDLCAAFVSTVPKNWVIYPETGGFDLVLVEEATGVQIGIEAKLALNAKVIKNNCAN